MRIVIRLYEDGVKKPYIDEFKDDAPSLVELENVKDSIAEFLDEGLQKWQEIMEDSDVLDD